MNQIDQVSERLGNMEAKIDILLEKSKEFSNIDKLVAQHESAINDMKPKVKELHESQLKSIGFAACASLVLTFIGNAVINTIRQ